MPETRGRPTGYQSGRLNRSPSFRRAFLLAYANRIGERLEAAGDRGEHRGNVEPRRGAGTGTGSAGKGGRHDVRPAVPGDPADASKAGRRARLACRPGRSRPGGVRQWRRWRARSRARRGEGLRTSLLHGRGEFVPGHLRAARDVELLRDPYSSAREGPAVGSPAGCRRCRRSRTCRKTPWRPRPAQPQRPPARPRSGLRAPQRPPRRSARRVRAAGASQLPGCCPCVPRGAGSGCGAARRP